jgi:hypothetical protein
MIRIVIDSVAVLCAFLMVARMKPAVTPFAMRIGLIGAGLHTAGQLAIYFSPVRLPDAMSPDLALSAVVFGFTALTFGRWERLVADEYLADPKSGRNDLHGKVAWVMVPVLIFALLFDSAVR